MQTSRNMQVIWFSWVGRLAIVILIVGCGHAPDPASTFSVDLSPREGHPPFQVQIRATDMGGGMYVFDLPSETVEQVSPVLHATVDADPWEVRVTWSDPDGNRLSAIGAARIVNSAPIIRRPLVLPGPGWYLTPLVRTLLDFNYKSSAVDGATGIYDPDGDDWHIVSIQVTCSEKFGLPDSVFTPPREAGVFQALYQGEGVPNACIIYPTHTGKRYPVTSSSSPPAERVEFVEPFTYSYPGSTEYLSLRNTGTRTVDLTGWTITSDQGATFRFPSGFLMYAGTVVRVHTRSGSDSSYDLYWDHSQGEVWHDTEGSATLRNPEGTVVHEYIYPGLPFARTPEAGYPYAPNNPHDLTFDYLKKWFSDPRNFVDWADRHMPAWRQEYGHVGTGSVEDIMACFFSDNCAARPDAPPLLPVIRSGTATITVIASDEWGAVSSATFEIPVGARDFFYGTRDR